MVAKSLANSAVDYGIDFRAIVFQELSAIVAGGDHHVLHDPFHGGSNSPRRPEW